MGRDLLLPTFLFSLLSARLAACELESLYFLRSRPPPAQSNGRPDKILANICWRWRAIIEEERLFYVLQFFVFLYFPSSDCLTSSL